jgi:hypothetical protein
VPFTFAHPAAVLPLRRVLWLPGLVAGSVAPDVGYYLPLPAVLGGATHSVTALVGMDLVLAALVLLCGYLAAAPLMALTPSWLRRAVRRPDLGKPVRSWLAAITAGLSLVVGASTHLAWDAFTHTNGFAVQRWAPLREAVVGPHRVYNVVGYVSSVGGLVVLAAAGLVWLRNRMAEVSGEQCDRGESRSVESRSVESRSVESWCVESRSVEPWSALPPVRRVTVVVCTALGAMISAVVALADPVSSVSEYDWVRQLLLGGIQGIGVVLGLYVIAWYTRWGKAHLLGPRRPPEPRHGHEGN